ncbi:hypothetical protein M0802_016807, partial [Mischocyttarus mexicanus]
GIGRALKNWPTDRKTGQDRIRQNRQTNPTSKQGTISHPVIDRIQNVQQCTEGSGGGSGDGGGGGGGSLRGDYR